MAKDLTPRGGGEASSASASTRCGAGTAPASCGRPATSATAAGCPRTEVERLRQSPGATAPATASRPATASPAPHLGRGRRGDGAGRDRGRAAPGHRRDHPRLGRGARAGRGRRGDGDGQGDLGDGRARSSEVRRAAVAVALALAAVGFGACGDDGDDDRAASSSSPPPPRCSDRLHRVRRSRSRTPRSGSRSPAPTSSRRRSARARGPTSTPRPTPTYPDELYEEGLVEQPVAFRRPTSSCSRVPTDSRHRLAVETSRSPGRHARDRRPRGPGRRLHARGARSAAARAVARRSSPTSRSEEPDVAGIVAKLTARAPSTPASSTPPTSTPPGASSRRSRCPASCSPTSPTASRSSTDAANPELAQQFVDGLLDGDGQRALAARRASCRPRERAAQPRFAALAFARAWRVSLRS